MRSPATSRDRQAFGSGDGAPLGPGRLGGGVGNRWLLASGSVAPAATSSGYDGRGTSPAGGITDMADEHTKGAINKAKGKVEEGVGKLTGDRQKQARGKAKQVQGGAQQGLGDIQDAVRRPKDKP
jgi:uncharacterized protein YjbJ (UPF0337 family)